MERTKLYQALTTLTKAERHRLRKFVDCQTSRRSQLLMHQILYKIEQDLEAVPSRKEIWEETFEGSFDDLKFRKDCSDAVRLLEQFLSWDQYWGDPLTEGTLRLMSLGRKGLEHLYSSQLKRVQKLLSRQPEQGANYYYHKFLVQQNLYEMRQANLQRFEIANIDNILDNLDTFYVIEKLRYYCEILSRKSFVEHDYQNRLIGEILSLIENGAFEDIPVVHVYHKIVLTHLHPNEQVHYYELKRTVIERANYLPLRHRKGIFDALLNYCNRKINQGHSDFLQESFALYRQVLDDQFSLGERYITHWTFKNVVVLALRLGEFSWAENFILRSADRIEQPFRKNAVNYNLAQLYFYQKKFEHVLTLLQEVEYEDVSYNLGAKTMLLATYYELGEYEALKTLGNAFRVFLHRRKNTITEDRRRSYLNLISLTIRLSTINPRDSKALIKLRKRMESIPVVASENWIRTKISDKIQRHPTYHTL